MPHFNCKIKLESYWHTKRERVRESKKKKFIKKGIFLMKDAIEMREIIEPYENYAHI